MFGTIVDATLKLFKKYPGVARDMATSSMTQYTRSTRTEPITMIDSTLTTMSELSDLMVTLTSIYAAMYAQSFSIAINQEIGDIKVLKTLDKINPNRSKTDSLLSGVAGLESNNLQLPDYVNLTGVEKPVISVGFGMESNFGVAEDSRNIHGILHNEVAPAIAARGGNGGTSAPATTTSNAAATAGDKKDKPVTVKSNSSSSVDVESINSFMSNLSTGLLFDVSVEAEGRKVSIPISVRLLANKMPSTMVVSLFHAAVRNQTAKERYREWRAGGISLWSDVILCRDIAREQRKNLIKDTTGMYSEVLRRKASNQGSGLLSGNPSISQISNIIVVSSDTVDAFERASGKKMNNLNVRSLLFKNIQTLIIAVVNRTRETVTLHYHDINVPTTVTFKELTNKSGGKGGSPDVMEILKAYQMGNGINL